MASKFLAERPLGDTRNVEARGTRLLDEVIREVDGPGVSLDEHPAGDDPRPGAASATGEHH
jgi:hypothetical protein